MRDCVDEMVEEHQAAGDTLKIIAALSNDYTPPEGACTTYSVLYKNLQAFEADLHKHVHLENNILLPKAEALLQD
ncbi:MAG: hemerythrin domain-containing protein [Cyclonatronaceae bacterium]